ncbi:hypothetical protein [Bacteroides thetaiotaomicron]|uniref:hypothetical protein n=1 Tax=Bacteroides thetaiotaomicron TaxID=818 RepID=UPI001F3BDADF|nr:hypothetical protein [Bacteroides thetaiotaomicron]
MKPRWRKRPPTSGSCRIGTGAGNTPNNRLHLHRASYRCMTEEPTGKLTPRRP